jgi:hypothetical protein
MMFSGDAGGILHGHLKAGERHDFGAECDVRVVERGALQGIGGGHGGKAGESAELAELKGIA